MRECGQCGKQYEGNFCPDCGEMVAPGMRFCANCGYDFSKKKSSDEIKGEKTISSVGSVGLSYKVNDDGVSCTIVGLGRCYDTEIIIPTVINGYAVTSIGYAAFEGCTGLTSITLPFVGAIKDGTSNTHFGYVFGASSYSSNSSYVPQSLKTVVINGGSIGGAAFSGCTGLASVTIGNGVTSIGDDAFRYCTGLISVTIGNGVKSIGNEAFYGCKGLTSVTIPDSVTSIGESAFYGCTGLTSVHITDLAAWCGISFGNYSANPLYYVEKLYLNGNLVTDLVIPDSVTSIGSHAFRGCTGLTSVTIPDSVTSIGSSAFYGCTGLTSITLPFAGASRDATGYQSHFGYIFGYSSSSSSSGGYHYYEYKSNTYTYYTYYIPASLCQVVITGGSIGDRAFSGCTGLTSVTIPDSVTSIGGYAFSDCTGLTSVTIGNGVTSIGESAFYGCKGLTSVTIPDSVTSIGENAFYNCKGLTSVTIPDSVKSIGNRAFYGCTGLTSIKYRGSSSDWSKISKDSYWNYNTGNYTITYNYTGE